MDKRTRFRSPAFTLSLPLGKSGMRRNIEKGRLDERDRKSKLREKGFIVGVASWLSFTIQLANKILLRDLDSIKSYRKMLLDR